MTRLIEIQGELAELQGFLSRIDELAAAGPAPPSVAVTAASLRKRVRELEAEFSEESAARQVDVCRYRLFRNCGTPSAMASAMSLVDFQELVSHVYDVLGTKTKSRARTSDEAIRETSFQIGYVFPGSIGFALTLPAENWLIDDDTSPIDNAIEEIFALANAETSEATTEAAQRLGPSVIRLMHKWISRHNHYSMGIDIQWHRRETVKSQLFKQPKELVRLASVFKATKESVDDDVSVEGEYVGGDVDKQTFHMKVPGAADITASFHESFDQLQLPEKFRTKVIAHFLRRTKTHVVTGERDARYLLKRIDRAL
jgi:hypothetical protein